MDVLIVGMQGKYHGDGMRLISGALSDLNYGELYLCVAENFTEALYMVQNSTPDVLHLTNDVGIPRLRYSDGCERLAQACERLPRKPLINYASNDLYYVFKPAFERHMMSPRCVPIWEAVRIRVMLNRTYRNAS